MQYSAVAAKIFLPVSHLIKVLDLNDNKLSSLPQDIGKLTSLQVEPLRTVEDEHEFIMRVTYPPLLPFVVLLDFECGEESFKEPSGIHRGSKAPADSQSKRLNSDALFMPRASDFIFMSFGIEPGIFPAVLGNCLSELPSGMSSLCSLRTLDVSDNLIVQIPKTFAYLRTLEVRVHLWNSGHSKTATRKTVSHGQ